MAEAMEYARRSVEHRTNFFVTPLAMPSSRVAAPRPAPDPRGPKRSAEEAFEAPRSGAAPRQEPGQGKAKGKGKDKKGKKGPRTHEQLKEMSQVGAYKVIRADPDRYRLSFKGDDGIPRCHNYQMGRCTTAGCKFSHVCTRCGGSHPVTRCPEMGLNR